MKIIPLKNSTRVALVDDADFDKISKYKWRAVRGWGNSYRAMTGHCTYMHHLIIGKPPGNQVTDHIDQNGLNNQKGNLRFVNKSFNALNSKTRIDNTSGRKGVSFSKNEGKWKVHGSKNGIAYCLGTYLNFSDAVNARVHWENQR